MHRQDSTFGNPVETGRVERVEYDSKVTGNKRPAMVYLPPGYSSAQQVSGAVPAARHRRQREPLDAVRRGRRDSRQPDCRQQSGADDRRDAQRPRVERTVDRAFAGAAARWRRADAARREPVQPVPRQLPHAPAGARAGRGRQAPAERCGARAVAAAPAWPSSSPPMRRSSRSCSAI